MKLIAVYTSRYWDDVRDTCAMLVCETQVEASCGAAPPEAWLPRMAWLAAARASSLIVPAPLADNRLALVLLGTHRSYTPQWHRSHARSPTRIERRPISLHHKFPIGIFSRISATYLPWKYREVEDTKLGKARLRILASFVTQHKTLAMP